MARGPIGPVSFTVVAAVQTVWHSVAMALPTFDPRALFAARVVRGWSRSKLAEVSGVSDETIRRAEVGAFVPREETLLRLAIALDLTPLDLLSERAA